MGECAIRITDLGKQYQLGAREQGYATFREALISACAAPYRRLRRLSGASDPGGSFWALKGVSFEVEAGETVGIIGRNGAGKSTLLKVLSQITEPTTGEVRLHGRVASLLEVGTGFHPELTGRENIYLNGSLRGMMRAEIDRKFDEIVAFAEAERFLDTPVKWYSSGMYVRLAFAVAAHLEPEILIVDEVLAVGDATFQKRCLEKMRTVARDGRTVLVVSHQLEVIRRLCGRSVWLQQGQVNGIGPTDDILKEYLSADRDALLPGLAVDLSDRQREGSGVARFARMVCTGADGGWPRSGGALVVDLELAADADVTADSLAVTLYDRSGFKLVNADTVALCRAFRLRAGVTRLSLTIRHVYLKPGDYRVGLSLARLPSTVYDHVEAAGVVTVADDDRRELGPKATNDGVVVCDFEVEEGAPVPEAAAREPALR
jgi:lipopolysaccharide transport system ATP-binding protein